MENASFPTHFAFSSIRRRLLHRTGRWADRRTPCDDVSRVKRSPVLFARPDDVTLCTVIRIGAPSEGEESKAQSKFEDFWEEDSIGV